mmetsp:Transcript_107617/g.213826  ORF Transcript_107617/g.213826 Transcript_107617/m.213826 type:complete len:349 (-) Transcript_107617:186-1232(-)
MWLACRVCLLVLLQRICLANRRLADRRHEHLRIAIESPDSESEDKCELVNKRGIMYSCDVYPLQPHSDETTLDVEHYLNKMAKADDGATVYVITSALPTFRSLVLPHINSSFVLVTGDAVSTPEAILQENFDDFASDARITKWFAQNADQAHPKLESLPNGLDYHTLKAGHHELWGPRATPKSQEVVLQQVLKGAPKFRDRSPLVHDGGLHTSSPSRTAVQVALSQQPNLVHQSHDVSRREFWVDASQYRFGASPRGVGIDCHRTWEFLILGTIPLLDVGAHNRLFHIHGLPIVELSSDEWRHLSSVAVKKKMDVAQKVLEETRSTRTSLPPALTLKYWVDRIREAAK